MTGACNIETGIVLPIPRLYFEANNAMLFPLYSRLVDTCMYVHIYDIYHLVLIDMIFVITMSL